MRLLENISPHHTTYPNATWVHGFIEQKNIFLHYVNHILGEPISDQAGPVAAINKHLLKVHHLRLNPMRTCYLKHAVINKDRHAHLGTALALAAFNYSR